MKIVHQPNHIEARRKAYPSVEDQLDMMFHDPEKWRAKIAAIKARYPKPKDE